MTNILDVVIIGATILGLWLGAVWVVEGASRIAKRLGMSELVIGLTVVAIGPRPRSLPSPSGRR